MPRIRAVLVALVVMAGCAGPTANPSTTPSSAPSVAASASPSASSSPELSCAERVLGELTPEQRIGQLFLLGLTGNHLGAEELSAIRNQHIGSVWFTQTTSIGVDGLRAIADAVQAEASTATGGVGFFVAANQEGGLIQALNGSGFSTIPSAVDQGAMAPDVLADQAEGWGEELQAAGVNLDFAPVADVVPPGGDATNAPIGAHLREYGHDPVTAGTGAAAFISGMAAAGVATTAKHFPGLGRVVGNTDFTANVVDSATTLTDPYLDAFRATIDAGVPFVMIALATYTQIDPAKLAAFSPVVI
ncbi:MAG TPA: glycoside hydrolase family 3 N-terminal domain-containing protein, partial [Candidatus Limnocylindria bacterium]